MGVGFQTVLSERHSESVRFVWIERHVPCVGPVCDLSRSAVSEEAAAWRSEGCQMVRQRVESSAKRYRGFSRVGEIIDEKQKKNRAQNATLRNSSLDRKRR